MSLIQKEDIMDLIPTNNPFLKEGFYELLSKFIMVDELNLLYEGTNTKQGLAGIEHILNTLEITCNVSDSDLSKIPKTGPFILVANHPFGLLDGLILLKAVCSVRPDFKVMANFLLNKADSVNEFFIPVNPFSDAVGQSSFSGIRQTLALLKKGTPIGIFPAGEVSSYQIKNLNVSDRPWSKSIIKLIKKAEVPVVPVYFDGSNSLAFQFLGLIHSSLRTLKIPSELFNKKGATITLRIGSSISVSEQIQNDALGNLGKYIRNKTYSLGLGIPLKKSFINWPALATLPSVIPIQPPIEVGILNNEISQIKPTYLINTTQNFESYIAPASAIPNILLEIGRLREITFRAIGEGTNLSIDLDKYDEYYQHLFVWDKETQQVIGSYRIGKGDEILEQFGKRGFYTHSLFKIKDELIPILNQSIELGRSFIIAPYQGKRLPLFLLWQGILTFLLKHNECRYLFGPVSISNDFSKISKSLMVDFIKKNHYDHHLAQYIRPRKQFKPNLKKVAKHSLLDMPDSLQILDKLIRDLEPKNFSIPVLIKKYISMNARFIGFNVDPKFNYSLDGLIILDIEQAPVEMIDNIRKNLV